MNKPSERIVVFVTPAQKRAISATADELGISVSELMRRAVIAFSATSDQVKAASIVDRLNAPREPDALAQVLRKAAKPLRVGRGAGIRPPTQVQLQAQEESADAPQQEPALNHAERELAQTVARLAAQAHAAEWVEPAEPEERAADGGNSHSDTVSLREGPPLQPLSNAPFARTQRVRDETGESDSDAAPEGGKFA
ncbi:transposase-like protein [Paraburkholderia bannensis]|uniref:Transposase-like protein n=1 Tax=Paraburkholderia bannensis TaxID=765414 RepID=A0A7W9WRL8_9BURK|nr:MULTISPECIES: hypothetical protein [Paraburkholderia]MBB3256625.1 hypothetical protein [Paraburkholderia sp. WP4_3_2]MBB6101624.1 transposase-like protein [Paraburkholderia bannensis]